MTGTTKSVIAVTWAGTKPPDRWTDACAVLGSPADQNGSLFESSGTCVVGADYADGFDPRSGRILLHLTHGARVGDRNVTDADVTTWLSTDTRHPGLDEVLPPFAVVHRASAAEPLRLATDYLGFRNMYVCSGPGWAAFSTSGKALAVLAGAEVDQAALASYSLIGWQIGRRTHFAGVEKLPPGALVTLRGGRMELSAPPRVMEVEQYARLSDAVSDAAAFLRTAVNAVLADHPDTWLQLTGGLDSRILLGAVDPARRPELRAMTLEAAGNPDAAMAASLAARFGMRHRVVQMSEVHELSPLQALELSLEGAHRLEYSADPLAWAALAHAEGSLEQSPRLAGLGGEVVRGFYYLGPLLPVRSSPRRVSALARWRLFPNESVADEVLDPAFAAGRRASTIAELQRIFEEYPRQWNQATDSFYLWQRMQRWAGVTTTSTVQDRLAVNVMLDPRFIAIGRRVPPRWRTGMRYLSSIMCALDEDLARLPLDGRPAPTVYAHPTLRNRARLTGLTAGKAGRKVSQRLSARTRPAVGGESLAELVVQQWRSDPVTLEPVIATGLLRPGWLEGVLDADTAPSASAVGFVVTLAAAAGTTDPTD